MPDLAMENARNVTINLKEEHGQYVMLQLSFAAKWILISEITFFSGEKIRKYKITEIPPSKMNNNNTNVFFSFSHTCHHKIRTKS